MADALDSGSNRGNSVEVQVLLSAPRKTSTQCVLVFLFRCGRGLEQGGGAQRRKQSHSAALLSPRFSTRRNVYRDDYRLVVDGTGLQRPYLLGNRSPCIHRHSDFRPDGKLIPRIKKRQVSPKSRDLSLLYFCTLQRRIAEAVHQRVDVLAGLAHGAVAAVEAGVIRQAGGVEDGRDLVAQTFMGGGKDG